MLFAFATNVPERSASWASIFTIPGLGKHFIEATINRDYTLVLGTVLFYATLILMLNLIVDILQAWLNPRIRTQ